MVHRNGSIGSYRGRRRAHLLAQGLGSSSVCVRFRPVLRRVRFPAPLPFYVVSTVICAAPHHLGHQQHGGRYRTEPCCVREDGGGAPPLPLPRSAEQPLRGLGDGRNVQLRRQDRHPHPRPGAQHLRRRVQALDWTEGTHGDGGPVTRVQVLARHQDGDPPVQPQQGLLGASRTGPSDRRSAPELKCFVGRPSETRFRFVLRQPTDTSRELLLTVLAFDVPRGVSG